MSVEQFANELGVLPALLLEQLQAAGVSKHLTADNLTENDKTQLFDYLRKIHGAKDEKSKISLLRRQTSEIKKPDNAGKPRRIIVEVRKKQTLVKDEVGDRWGVDAAQHALREEQARKQAELIARQTAEIKKSDSTGKASNIQVEVRKRPVVVKDDLSEIRSSLLVSMNGYNINETKGCNNMEFDVLSPVPFYYDWPGRFKPFDHQKVTTEFLAKYPRSFCLNDMGTGKSLSGLWAYDYLRSQGMANRMLIASPLSTLERTWGDELFRNFPHLTFSVLHGSRDKRFKLLEQEVDVYIINHDGVKIMHEALAARADIDTVIIDEISQAARNASTGRWKSLKKTIADKPRVWGFTGTPTPNAPTDAWAQCRLINPSSVGPYFGAFRDQVMKKISPSKFVARDGALEIVSNAMQPAIRFKRDECIDLPPKTYETRTVEMSTEQNTMYKAMLTRLHSEYEGAQITAFNEAVKAMKLVQIACGVVYDNDSEPVVIPAPKRLAVTREIIDEAGSKVIVFVPFTSALEAVAEYLRQYFTVEIVSGATSKTARDQIFGAFQNSPVPRVLVANAGVMSHGLSLTAASVIVWFAPTSSAETYEQAGARISRPGQKLNQLIVNIEGSLAERVIYKRVQEKSNMQGLLLDIIEERCS
jgi:SNF2 family DNA or RNA helicase